MPFLEIPSGRVFYKDSPASDPSSSKATLVLQHGLGSTHNWYQSIVPALTAAPYNYRCVAYDAIGSGISSSPEGAQTIETVAEDVIAVMDNLKIQKAVFAGHSFGGIVAAHLAIIKADRIVAAIMLGPVLPGGDEFTKAFETRIQTVKERGMEAMADTIPTDSTGSKSLPLQRAFLRQALLSQDLKGYQSLCAAIGAVKTPDYGKIEIPTLIIAGEEDKPAPLSGCEEIQRRIGSKNKQFKVVERMGHQHCIEAPEVTIEFIGDFVSGLT